MRIINGLASRKEVMEPYGGLKFSQLDQAEVTEDLKAFERRLTEYVGCIGPQTGKWRLILVMSSVWTLYTAWGWLTDSTQHKSFFQSVWYHIFFTISCCNLLFLFLIGIHRRVMAPQIILARTRLVLQDYNMSCDEKGRLILKPRPT